MEWWRALSYGHSACSSHGMPMLESRNSSDAETVTISGTHLRRTSTDFMPFSSMDPTNTYIRYDLWYKESPDEGLYFVFMLWIWMEWWRGPVPRSGWWPRP
jgi:hypothetical protein